MHNPCQSQAKLPGLFPFSLSELRSTLADLNTFPHLSRVVKTTKPTAHSFSNLTHSGTNLPPVITRGVPSAQCPPLPRTS